MFYLDFKLRCVSTGWLRLTATKVYLSPVHWLKTHRMVPSMTSIVSKRASVMMNKTKVNLTGTLVWTLGHYSFIYLLHFTIHYKVLHFTLLGGILLNKSFGPFCCLLYQLFFKGSLLLLNPMIDFEF